MKWTVETIHLFFSQKGWIRVFSAAEVWSSFKYDYLQDVDYKTTHLMYVSNTCITRVGTGKDFQKLIFFRISTSISYKYIPTQQLQCADLCDENLACASFEFRLSTSEGLGRRSSLCRFSFWFHLFKFWSRKILYISLNWEDQPTDVKPAPLSIFCRWQPWLSVNPEGSVCNG